MTDKSGRPDGYYGCSLPPGACGCPQDVRHKCASAHWIATPSTRDDGAEGACPNCGSTAPDHSFGCFRAPPKPAPDAMRDRVEAIAQWLHDETGHPEAYPSHTWPETERDDGQREGGFLKIVPLHGQEYFRDIARRLVARFDSAPVPPADDMVDREALIAKYRAVRSKEAQFIALCIEAWSPSPAVAAAPGKDFAIADQWADYSEACDKVRREMRALVLERNDPKLSSLYYRSLMLSEHEAARRTLLSLPVQPDTGERSFQQRVLAWLMECFSMETCRNGAERNHRFLEEALELVQSLGCTSSEAHQLVDYVFERPAGEPTQELGGVMVTIAALCFPHELDMKAAAETELARVWKNIEKIREKQEAKPKHSPLPELFRQAPHSSSEKE